MPLEGHLKPRLIYKQAKGSSRLSRGMLHTGGQTDEQMDGRRTVDRSELTLVTSVSRHQVIAERQVQINAVRMKHFQLASRWRTPHTVAASARC